MGLTRRAKAIGACVLAALLSSAAPAAAQDPPPEPAAPAADAPDAERLTAAKNLFRSGVALMNTGDYERALGYFQRSRAQVPSIQNTTDVAICLDKLGRYDEALDMYEELLLRFSSEMADADKKELGPVMAALRAKVGAVRVTANVDGRVVIDGRARGDLPASAPLRVLGGKHTVRVFRDGYTAFETKVDVPVGSTVAVEGHLEPLADAGLLRVDDPSSEGFDVIVDGSFAGRVPWEGTLLPGRHLVWTRRGDQGSAPHAVEVFQSQTTLLRMSVADLGPALGIAVAPASARIQIDGVPLGAGSWLGRLPVGHHEVLLAEEGYFPRRIAVEVSASATAPEAVEATLEINPDHPRWPRPAAGQLFVGLFGGYGGSHALGSDPGTQQPEHPSGDILGLRAGYRFRQGFAAELSLGYIAFRGAPETPDRLLYLDHYVDYQVKHWIQARGFFAGVGGSYRAAILPWLGVSPRLTLGIAALTAHDDLTGTATDDIGRKASIFVTDPRSSGGDTSGLGDRQFFVMPELSADVTFRGFFAGLGLGLAFFPGRGPVYPLREIGVTPVCGEAADLGSVGCAPNVRVPPERLYRDFVLFLPQLSVGRVF